MANSGIIPFEPASAHSAIYGAMPQKWAGEVDRDGTAAPWLNAPIGSEYTYITGSAATLYLKSTNDGDDADWVAQVSALATGFVPMPLSNWHKVVSNDIGERVYNNVLTRVSIPLASLREVSSNDIAALAAHGGILATDSTPTLEYVNGDTDSELRSLWASSNSDPVVFQLGLPSDLDTGLNMTLSVRGVMSGSTDTPVIDLDTYFDTGDTKVSDATSAFSDTESTVTATIAAADIPAGARTVTVEMTPGAHTTDTLAIYWIELQYYRSSTDPALAYANGDTDSSFELTWAASEVTPVVQQVPLPPDLDTSANITFHFRGEMGGSTDTPTIASDVYFNEGDTKVEDTSTALGSAYAEETITIAAADVPSGAQTMTIELTPGAHTTDALAISASWLEYTKSSQ